MRFVGALLLGGTCGCYLLGGGRASAPGARLFVFRPNISDRHRNTGSDPCEIRLNIEHEVT